jgi:hypothetical protein
MSKLSSPVSPPARRDAVGKSECLNYAMADPDLVGIWSNFAESLV